LTEKQREFLQNCNHRWNVKTGATGSGKSFADFTVVIPQRILASRGEGLLVLLGNTRGTLERNILEPMAATTRSSCSANGYTRWARTTASTYRASRVRRLNTSMATRSRPGLKRCSRC